MEGKRERAPACAVVGKKGGYMRTDTESERVWAGTLHFSTQSPVGGHVVVPQQPIRRAPLVSFFIFSFFVFWFASYNKRLVRSMWLSLSSVCFSPFPSGLGEILCQPTAPCLGQVQVDEFSIGGDITASSHSTRTISSFRVKSTSNSQKLRLRLFIRQRPKNKIKASPSFRS